MEGVAEAKVPPGHLKDFEGRVSTKAEMGGEKPPLKRDMCGAICGYVAGEGDFIFRYGSEGKAFGLPLVPVEGVAAVLKRNRERFGFQRDKSGRDIVDMTTTLTIPVPGLKDESGNKVEELIFKGRGEKHFSPLLELLREVQKRLCYPEEKKEYLPDAGRLDLERLKEGHSSYGLPVSLRRTIEYLYRDFAIIIADPFLFDVVLDLYDTFATLHAVLTEHLPEQLKAKDEPRRIGRDLLLLEGGRVEQIGMLVDAIHNALMHRILKVYPECRVRDMAIDFRGGLNQVLLTVDAPMKCGLGLLRRYVLHKENEYDVVGVLTRVGFRPDARCCSLRLRTEKEAQLAYYDVDVPHVLHVMSYCDYLHEAFHLIFDALVLRGPLYAYANFTSVMRDRMSEIFAILLHQILVFGSDTKASLYHLIAGYSRSLTSIGVNDEETIVRFTEMMIRLFAAMDAVESVKEIKIEESPVEWSKRDWPHEGENLDDALERFKKMVSNTGPFFLVCKIFRSYISRITQAEGKRVHLCRNKEREVFYEGKDWYEFQIDRGAVGMFCPMPEERRKRVQKQIAILRSLWDVSSNLRARRLTQILEDNFGRIE